MQLLFNIGFLPIRIWDILDILIVGYLIYQIYKLLRGSIAFNIFIGVLTLYVVWWLVNQLDMDLLSAVLGQFTSVGVFIIVVIFQQEIRRFLLFLGNSTLRQRSNVIGSLFFNRNWQDSEQRKKQIRSISRALRRMSQKKVGALVVLANNIKLEGIVNAGVPMNASISDLLLESIFSKESPLHDGAVILGDGKIQAAGCILPVSENPNLPSSAGLRHRAAVGISERLNVASLVVSEETGHISLAYDGQLQKNLDEKTLQESLEQHYL